MTSQAYNNNDVLLFLLQIWKAGMLFLWLCFLPLILLEKSVVKLRVSEAAILGDKKNNIHEERN